MTNAEKYKEVFGVDADTSACPTKECTNCPCALIDIFGNVSCEAASTYDWWNAEYKVNNNV